MRILHVYLSKELAYEDFFEMNTAAVKIPELTYCDVNGDVNALVYPGADPVTWASSYDEILYYDEELQIQEIISNKE